jgi:hypothetical protein
VRRIGQDLPVTDQPQRIAGQSFAGQSFVGQGNLDVGTLDDVVSAVWDHKDEVATAITFVRDHGDDLVKLASQLPDLLEKAAAALAEAAGDTRATAQFLTGAGTAGGGVKKLSEAAGDALETCRDELDDVRALVVKAADLLGRLPMMDDIARSLANGVAHLDGAGTQLAAVAQSLRGMARWSMTRARAWPGRRTSWTAARQLWARSSADPQLATSAVPHEPYSSNMIVTDWTAIHDWRGHSHPGGHHRDASVGKDDAAQRDREDHVARHVAFASGSQRSAACPLKSALRATLFRATRLPSSKKPVLVRARVIVACATASPSSARALVLRLLTVSHAWW